MYDEKANLTKEYCGAVAVSWYRSEYTNKAIDLLLYNKVETNIHFYNYFVYFYFIWYNLTIKYYRRN